MPICLNCNGTFPNKVEIDGKMKDLRRRKYCFDCNPKGERRFWGGKPIGSRKDSNGKRILLKKRFICKVCGKDRYQKTRNLECATCRSRRIRHDRKDFAIRKLGGKCRCCGYSRCRSALAFHHIDGKEKELHIARCWETKWKKLLAELEKCVLLCHNCHSEVHDGMRKIRFPLPTNLNIL